MEGHLALFIFGSEIRCHARTIRVLGILVVRISVVYLIFSLIENLEFHKVESLLYEVNISKVLQVQNKFCDSSQRHIIYDMYFTSEINGYIKIK